MRHIDAGVRLAHLVPLCANLLHLADRALGRKRPFSHNRVNFRVRQTHLATGRADFGATHFILGDSLFGNRSFIHLCHGFGFRHRSRDGFSLYALFRPAFNIGHVSCLLCYVGGRRPNAAGNVGGYSNC